MSAKPESADVHTGIVVALLAEARCLSAVPAQRGCITTLDDGSRLCLSGMGPLRATDAARALIEDGASALLSWGTCGALRKGLDAGSVLMPVTVMDDSGEAFAVDPGWRQRVERALPTRLTVEGGLLLSSARPLSRVTQKTAAHAATAAAAVDMESAAVAAVAAAAGVPFLALRVVLDRADQALPAAALSAVDELGRPRAWPLLRALALRPWQLRQLMALGRGFSFARRSLRQLAACAPARLAFEGMTPA